MNGASITTLLSEGATQLSKIKTLGAMEQVEVGHGWSLSLCRTCGTKEDLECRAGLLP